MRHGAPAGLRVRGMRRTDVSAIARIEAERHPVGAWSSTAFHDALDGSDRYLCLVVVGVPSPGGHDQRGGPGADEGGPGADEGGVGADGVVAYGVVSVVGGVADLDNLTVRGDHERRGIGRWLLGLLLDAAVDRNAGEVLLEVRHDNGPAIALYAADGFAAISRRRSYYAPGMDAIVMRRDLHGLTAMEHADG